MPVKWDNVSAAGDNMSLDSKMLISAESGNLEARTYTWSEAWVTLGKNQTPQEDLISELVPYSIRPTGGKAVLHGHDITYTVAMPLNLLGADQRNLRVCYRRLTRPIIQALCSCGLPVALAEDTPFSKTSRGPADCFAQNSPNDIVEASTGRKVCGCALRVTGRAILMQTSIPYTEHLVDPRLVIRDSIRQPIHNWDCSNFAELLSAYLTESLDVTISI